MDGSVDHAIDPELELLLGQPEEEAALEGRYGRGARFEAGQLRARAHDLHDGDNLLVVLAGRHHALQHEDLVVFKHVRALTAHHLDELGGQLERGVLEAEVLGRRR